MADDFDKTDVFDDDPVVDDKTMVMNRDLDPVDDDKTMVFADKNKANANNDDAVNDDVISDDKTMVYNDDKTMVYGGDDKTMIYGNKSPEGDDKTMVGMPAKKSGETTMRPEGPASRNGANESSAQYFSLKGLDYELVTCLSDNSGEAQVYLVQREGKEYVLKLYYQDEPEPVYTSDLLQDTRLDLTDVFGQLKDKKTGDYYFTVQAAGDGKTYLDGDESAKDKSGFHLDAKAFAQAPDGLRWNQASKAAYWHTSKEADFYEVTLYRDKEKVKDFLITSEMLDKDSSQASVYFISSMTQPGTYHYTVRAGREYKDENGAAHRGYSKVSASDDAKFSESEKKTIKINSVDDWMKIVNYTNKGTEYKTEAEAQNALWSNDFELAADLDFSNLTAEQQAQAKSWGNINAMFSGSFDGKGHKITGLTLSGGDGGLFQYVYAQSIPLGIRMIDLHPRVEITFVGVVESAAFRPDARNANCGGRRYDQYSQSVHFHSVLVFNLLHPNPECQGSVCRNRADFTFAEGIFAGKEYVALLAFADSFEAVPQAVQNVLVSQVYLERHEYRLVGKVPSCGRCEILGVGGEQGRVADRSGAEVVSGIQDGDLSPGCKLDAGPFGFHNPGGASVVDYPGVGILGLAFSHETLDPGLLVGVHEFPALLGAGGKGHGRGQDKGESIS